MSFAINSGKPVHQARRASSTLGLVEQAQLKAAEANETRPAYTKPSPRPAKGPSIIFGRRASAGAIPQRFAERANPKQKQKCKSQSLR